jgi:hypothetical protein
MSKVLNKLLKRKQRVWIQCRAHAGTSPGSILSNHHSPLPKKKREKIEEHRKSKKKEAGKGQGKGHWPPGNEANNRKEVLFPRDTNPL